VWTDLHPVKISVLFLIKTGKFIFIVEWLADNIFRKFLLNFEDLTALPTIIFTFSVKDGRREFFTLINNVYIIDYISI